MLPLLLSPERDEALLQLTEGRISVFSHDMVPDYLRTKPEPTAEQRMLQHEQKVRTKTSSATYRIIHKIHVVKLQANSLIAETAIKQVAQYTKVVSHVFDSVSKAREEWEVESSTRSGTRR